MGGNYRRHTFVTTETIPGFQGAILIARSHAAAPPRVYRLNEVGALIWHLLDGKTDLPALVRRVCEEYAADPRQTEDDVLCFLQLLEEAGVIYPEPPVASKSGVGESRH